MKVLSFGFGGGEENPHLPKNYDTNCVAYTGTHDNDTVGGWIATADEKTLRQAKDMLGFERDEDGPWAFDRAVMLSRADTAVLSMQDVLGLGGEARMNRPGTIGGNWMWRMLPGAAAPELAAKLKALNEESDRRKQG